MSVFIKGMEKPKNCFNCDFNMYDCYCKLNHGGIDRDFWFCETVCPISEVPEKHGRLIEFIDVPVFDDDDTGTTEICLSDVLEAFYKMREAPTIIEAEMTK